MYDDLVDVQSEVDRHEDAARPADAEERRHETGAVLAHDRDSLTLADAEPSRPAAWARASSAILL